MLARANRVIRAEDFRRVVRRGRRQSTGTAIVYVVESTPETAARFGFIVSRAVGNSVHRNLLRRRFRAIGRELVDAGFIGRDVVVRALPGAAELSWAQLRAGLQSALVPEATAAR